MQTKRYIENIGMPFFVSRYTVKYFFAIKFLHLPTLLFTNTGAGLVVKHCEGPGIPHSGQVVPSGHLVLN